jgi:hypothetical protein
MEIEIVKRIFRGTREEYLLVQPWFEEQDVRELVVDREVTVGPVDQVEVGPQRVHLSKDEIRRILLRKPKLENDHNHRKLFRILEEGHNKYTGASVLLDKLGLENDMTKLAGIMGSLGRRISQTPGIPKAGEGDAPLYFFLEIKKLDNEWHYRMKPELRDVLREMGYI